LLLLSARTLTPAVSSIGKTVAISSAPNQSLEIKNPATQIVPSNVAHEPFDLWYIGQAIEGHSIAIAAASVGLQRAMNTDVLRMALSVAESQAGEIQLLKSWRWAWCPVAPNMWQRHVDVEGIVAALQCVSLSEFDAAFLEVMIKRHRSAVVLGNDALRHGEHIDLRTFAHTTIDARESDLVLMVSHLDRLSPTPEITTTWT